MPELVKVVYDHGGTGWVADTYSPLLSGDIERADDQTDPGADYPSVTRGTADVEMPPRNASTDTWRVYAKGHGMPPEQADSSSRAELVALYAPEEG